MTEKSKLSKIDKFTGMTKKQKAFDYIRAIFYPDRCCMCGKVVVYGQTVCDTCRKEAKTINGSRCFSCGKAKNDCKCSGHANFYEAITSPFYYDGVVRTGIKLWKFDGENRNVSFWARTVARCVANDFGNVNFDFICFIPQTEDEMSERKYNQGQRLADEVGKYLDIPVNSAIRKIYCTRRQHSLPFYMKSGNVFGVFDVPDEQAVKGKTVLLIDDIKTSGTSINECAKMLELAGVEKVYCAVIAIR